MSRELLDPSSYESPGGYLNTASLGLPPRVVTEAMHDAVREWGAGRADATVYDEHVDRSRALFARLVGVPASWVAVGSQLSAAVGLIAASLPDDAHVVVPAEDFTSVIFPFLVQRERGVRVDVVPLAQLREAITHDVDLLAFSLVQSADGAVAPLDDLLERAAGRGVQVLLDVTQAAGWMPVHAARVDYLVCSAYKWLSCPRGVAFTVVRPEHWDEITPHAAGWYAGEDRWNAIYGPPLRLAADARRLDVSPAWLAWAGARSALELFAEADVEAIRDHDVALADGLRERLGMPPAGSAIVSLRTPGVQERLAAAGVRASMRSGAARLAFHAHNDEKDVELVAAALGV